MGGRDGHREVAEESGLRTFLKGVLHTISINGGGAGVEGVMGVKGQKTRVY